MNYADLSYRAEANDLSAYWLPFTSNKRFKADPRLLVRAEGMHYYTASGRALLDGSAGLWCVPAGHCRRPIAEAIARQASTLDYAPAFNASHPLAFALATRVASMLPEGLDHVFFTNSGSESVDTALKIALAYHRTCGEGSRTRLIGRERGYHGVGFGGISVGGLPKNRSAFGSLLTGVDHLPHTHDPVRNPFSRGEVDHGEDLADALQRIVGLHDASTIAAVIVEPVAGSTGVLPPPKGYLKRLRTLCDHYGILLIFDEVITGFGRLGAAFAAERFGVTPDLICMAKGLTNAAVPMGAVGCRDAIYDTILGAGGAGIELFHGYTSSGHPLACAAGLATLDLFVAEDLFARAKALEPTWADAVHGLRDARHVVDIRTIGLMAGIDLELRAGEPTQRAVEAFEAAFDRGVLLRVTGDTIALSPPLIIDEAQIGELVEGVRAVLETVK